MRASLWINRINGMNDLHMIRSRGWDYLGLLLLLPPLLRGGVSSLEGHACFVYLRPDYDLLLRISPQQTTNGALRQDYDCRPLFFIFMSVVFNC